MKYNLLFLLLLPMLSSQAPAQSMSGAYVSLETNFTLLDRFVRPTSDENFPPKKKTKKRKFLSHSHGARSLGLTKFRLSAEVQSLYDAQLFFVVRPDALLIRDPETGASQTYDPRPGTVYRKLPATELLDAYHISKKVGENLDISYGVFESIALPHRVIPDMFSFGLRALMPKKFLSLKLRFSILKDPLVTAGADVQTGQIWDVYVMAGREDRGETFSGSTVSFDRAPAGADPYMGGAGILHWNFSRQLTAHLLSGYLDRGIETGRVGETFAQASLIGAYELLQTVISSAFDFRYAKERWWAADQHASLTQISYGFNAGVHLNAQNAFIFGLESGESERHDEIDRMLVHKFKGRKTELGWQKSFGDAVKLAFMVSEETRKKSFITDDEIAGFENADQTSSRSYVRRFGLSLDYNVSTSAYGDK